MAVASRGGALRLGLAALLAAGHLNVKTEDCKQEGSGEAVACCQQCFVVDLCARYCMLQAAGRRLDVPHSPLSCPHLQAPGPSGPAMHLCAPGRDVKSCQGIRHVLPAAEIGRGIPHPTFLRLSAARLCLCSVGVLECCSLNAAAKERRQGIPLQRHLQQTLPGRRPISVRAVTIPDLIQPRYFVPYFAAPAGGE